ncbi:DUF58 domain-containing protein [Motiliproteus coralliicola]|uniref:DUF58 domain-containing protein n=1 Tax=Motiliproteus coralliicola TaxID=2283196 RepID=A0A369WQP2_9GAMM|nr:DUF58 domain-containing protein [Motiliproteus coralliicola]RDE24390.1 DUF58 domain-containing protein [Motiliproteus coralliicola]
MKPEDRAVDGVYSDLSQLLALRRSVSAATSAARVKQGRTEGMRLSRQRGRGLSFEELRHYRPGDDCRLLDWKATRRTGQPLVRVFTEERERPVWLLVDQRSGMFFGSQRRMKSVFAAELAALIGWEAHQQGDRVGSVIITNDAIRPWRPQRTQAQLLDWLKQLVACNHRLRAGAAPAPQRLPDALAEAKALIAHDARIYLLSDLDGWSDDCLALVGALRRHNEVAVLAIADPLEQQLPPGCWHFADHRGELSVDLGRSGVAQRYRENAEQRRQSIRTGLRRRQVDYIELDCQSDPAIQWRQVRVRSGGGV